MRWHFEGVGGGGGGKQTLICVRKLPVELLRQ